MKKIKDFAVRKPFLFAIFLILSSFFGKFTFTVPIAAVSGLSVWGATTKGVLKAVIISAFLFSAVHTLNAIAGNPSEALGQMAIALFESICLAAIVLCWGSIWPVVFIHGVTNWVLQTTALGYADYHGTANSYAFAVLLGLPLVALGVWWIFRGTLWYQHGASGN